MSEQPKSQAQTVFEALMARLDPHLMPMPDAEKAHFAKEFAAPLASICKEYEAMQQNRLPMHRAEALQILGMYANWNPDQTSQISVANDTRRREAEKVYDERRKLVLAATEVMLKISEQEIPAPTNGAQAANDQPH